MIAASVSKEFIFTIQIFAFSTRDSFLFFFYFSAQKSLLLCQEMLKALKLRIRHEKMKEKRKMLNY